MSQNENLLVNLPSTHITSSVVILPKMHFTSLCRGIRASSEALEYMYKRFDKRRLYLAPSPRTDFTFHGVIFTSHLCLRVTTF
eukprot:3519860-Pleurochrysis_carterae.AAC.3